MHLSYRHKDNTSKRVIERTITTHFPSPWGLMSISANEDGICKIGFSDDSENSGGSEPITPVTTVDHAENSIMQNIQSAIGYINGYETGENIRLCPTCTDFQFKVYRELLNIPSGKTATYSEVAAAIGQPTATRAVATAIAKNSIAILVPCHRVVPASGGPGKYAWGTDRKRMLLSYESLK